MQINQIISQNALKLQKRVITAKTPQVEKARSLFSSQDTVTLSSALSKPDKLNEQNEPGQLKADRLAEIKTRIHSGFYKTHQVTDDISNKMSDLFSDLTD